MKRFLIVLLFIGMLGFASAQTASYINYQARPGASLYGSQASTYWPILDNPDQCENREDILLNLAPLGCEPAVVRSDLLAEQNVPVFCQIDGMNINPLLDIKGIRNVRFTGQYPIEVAGVSYHPAKAALKTQQSLIGSPTINNLGYVVVVLKKNADESSLPEFVDVNLSAQLEYSSGNAFGIGTNEFKLEEQSLEEFEQKKAGQSFWNGRFSLRLADVNENQAAIEVFDGDFKQSSITVQKGQSSLIYVPGSYCQSALRVEYTGFEAKKERAKIEISDDSGSDVLWVYEGSRFLDNKCIVRDISVNNDSSGSLSVNCGSERFSISIENKNSSEGTLVDETLGGAEEVFNEAIAAYEKVADDYPVEEGSIETGSDTYAEEALIKAIALAKNTGKKPVTEVRLINKYLDLYPEGFRAETYQTRLNVIRSVDESDSGNVVLLDNRYRTVRVLEFEPGPIEEPSVTFSGGGKQGTFEVRLRNTESGFEKPLNRVRVDDIINDDSIEITAWCDAGANNLDDERHLVLERNIPEDVCPGVQLRVERISEYEKVAGIRIVPEAKRTESEANLHLKIGIEKRAIQLSTDKINQKLENLNESVERWNKISDSLGNVVSGMKAACLATSATLIAKNFLSGLDGTALARQQAMDGVDGWKARCRDEVARGDFVSVSACFNNYRDEIEGEVSARANANAEVDSLVSNIQTGDDVAVYDDEFTKQMIADMKTKYGDAEVNSYLGNGAENYTSYNDLKELAYNLELKKNGFSVDSDLSNIQDRIETNKQFYLQKVEAERSGGLLAVDSPGKRGEVVPAGFYSVTSNSIGGQTVSGATLKDGEKAVLVNGVANEMPGTYVVVGSSFDGELSVPSAVYEYKKTQDGIQLTSVSGYDGEQGASRFMLENKINRFRELTSSFNNQIIPTDRYVRYFGTGPDSGSAAVVPFDINSGWYARVVSVSAQIAAYDSSGLPKTWQICNVGSDGRIDGGDECQIIFSETAGGVPVLGLSDTESRRLIEESRRALLDANAQKGNKQIKIAGEILTQGALYSHYDSAECQDFMPISDCQLLFNVCDPVVCPSTRCDLGGEYPVADVVQTGIVGSALLCLPNFVGFGGDVAIPVCLTGIKSGVDGYVSILESHQQCLQESLETGNQIGICDQISSIYMCDFFWRQVTPVAREVLPRLISGSYNGFGRATRGGGEYTSVQAAFDNTDKSIDYFTQTYAVNSFEAFRARSIEEVGTEFCRAFVSLNVPTDFETLIAPESPPQFHAWFSSSTYTDVTVPATSQYKVFYHIFAGEDRGVSFSVYMKDPPSAGLYAIPSRVQVASGFIGRGDYKTESVDFTAPEGYKQLCVMINGEEECGFKQVSTSFAVNYVTDSIVSSEAERTDISTSKACISGSTSAAALLNANAQAGAEEALSPEIYNRGIVRICATRNPGEGTEPSRFVDVGYCDDENLRCWLDKKSVSEAITSNNIGVEKDTIQELERIQKEALVDNGDLYSIVQSDEKIQEFKDKLTTLDSAADAQSLVSEIEGSFSKFYLNTQKAAVLVIRAKALEKQYEFLAKSNIGKVEPESTSESSTGEAPTSNQDNGGQGNAGSEIPLNQCNIKLMNGNTEVPKGADTSFTADPFTVILQDCANAEKVAIAFIYSSSPNVVSKQVLVSDFVNGKYLFEVGSAKDFPLAVGLYQIRVLDFYGNPISETSFNMVGADNSSPIFAVEVRN